MKKKKVSSAPKEISTIFVRGTLLYEGIDFVEKDKKFIALTEKAKKCFSNSNH